MVPCDVAIIGNIALAHLYAAKSVTALPQFDQLEKVALQVAQISGDMPPIFAW
jgi:UDP-N-acetylmuramyl pentapeptide synthase